MPILLVLVECDDYSDLQWLRDRCVGAVEDVVETQIEEKRLDGNVQVNWDIED
jgi:hypothetical protein